ncbi:Beta-ketoadipate enol-lactone hydrolase [Indibacter alkaliphilus LW1]|uniref:Beta-ketoadipate enol-lactone hydrolase n=1 Tax=Indibacter alkaliphilus (strain CCUG 57479 / KCTC 22604 / LW1) TaxID=1189612 RepID=S2DKX2_INDAL|nr:alpha/beta hydrolase [Indibacter alkaliphilus]EOZ99759.1 Beta-ketoadipate enol-lactone hydrolase [Indibacter alkaliphilus LW1]
MPHIQLNNVKIFYQKEGVGTEVILFSHGLLWSHKMFEEQIKHLSKTHTVIAYDHRGQGQSEVTAGSYDMDLLTLDALELINKLVGKSVHFVGLSMGGFVGMRLASRYPDKIKSLILLETSANSEPVENLPKYKFLNGVVKWFGVVPTVAKSVMKIMFAESWLENPENKQAYKKWIKELQGNKKTITKSVEAVIYRKGVEEEIRNIKCPTMVVVGDEDIATKPEKAKFIQMSIPNAELHMLPGAGHSSSIEKPEEINRLISDWMQRF